MALSNMVPNALGVYYAGVERKRRTENDQLKNLATMIAMQESQKKTNIDQEKLDLAKKLALIKMIQDQQKAEAQTKLSNYVQTGNEAGPSAPGYGTLTGTAVGNEAALQQVMEAEAAGQPANVAAIDPRKVAGLAMQVAPNNAIGPVLKSMTSPDEAKSLSPIAKLNEDLKNNKISKADYDLAKNKLTREPPAKSKYTGISDDPLHPGEKIGFNNETGRLERIPKDESLGAQPIDINLHGEAFLKTLDPATANTVKSIAEGRLNMPSGFALKSPYWQNLLTLVGQYDPQYNQARVKVQQDFRSGKSAQNITAINTVIAHIGTMDEMVDALKNKNIPALNAAMNRFKTETGRPEIISFDIAKEAVANEMMRVFRQVQASQAETEKWASEFRSAGSPAQLKGAIKTGVQLLKGRLDAVNDQWKRGMGTEEGFPNIISEKSNVVLKRLNLSIEEDQPKGTGGYSDPDKERRYQEWKRKQPK